MSTSAQILKRCLPGPVRCLGRRLLGKCVDSHLIPWNCPPRSLLRQAAWSLRYRAAGVGIPLTANERRLLSFRNRHRGQRAFILGNGPSLNKCDLTLLKNEVTFGVNAIFLNYERMGFHPTYYVVEDVFVAEDRADEINAYRGPVKFFGNYLRYCLDDAPDTLWLNVRFRYDEYPGFPHFSRNAARMIWTGGTVSYLCMQLAYYMGFSEVYLVGFDHTYTVPADAVTEGTKIVSASDDVSHFHPDYFGKGYRWHDPRVDRMEEAYRRARDVYAQSGRAICNATVGGKLEVFDRVDFGKLLPCDKARLLPTDRKGRAKSCHGPMVSVIIPCYNTGRFLGEAIESVLAQTFRDFEVIVVDDGSTDDSADVARSYADPRVRYFYQENRGISAARNKGIGEARGEYIALLDADDAYLPTNLQKKARFLDDHLDTGLVASGLERISEKGEVFFVSHGKHEIVAPETQVVSNRFTPSTVVLRKSWADRVGGFDPELRGAEEYHFFSRLALAGCGLALLRGALVKYRYVASSLSMNIALQTAMRLKAVGKIFAESGAEPFAHLRPKALGWAHLRAAAGHYGLNQVVEGARHLGEAVDSMPGLARRDCGAFLEFLGSWWNCYPTDSPEMLWGRLLGNLPPKISERSRMIRRILWMKKRETLLVHLRHGEFAAGLWCASVLAARHPLALEELAARWLRRIAGRGR